MGRGKKYGPTGRRNFSTPDQIASGTSSTSKWRTRKDEEVSDEEEEDVEEESGEGEEEDDNKRKGVSGLIEISNPNLQKKDNIKAADIDLSKTTELSRREREELEKQRAKERFMKLQEQGKTEQAKKDLERLALIRRQREEAARKREEEKQAREAKRLESRK